MHIKMQILKCDLGGFISCNSLRCWIFCFACHSTENLWKKNELEINSVKKYELHKETLNVIHF